jgi:hypothetical protein
MNAVQSPVRPATCGSGAVSRACVRVIAGTLVVSRCARIGVPTPEDLRRRSFWSERLRHVHRRIHRLR